MSTTLAKAPVNLIAAAKAAELPVTLYRFAMAYVEGGCNNASEAWRETHPRCESSMGATVSASQALIKPNVQAAISAELGKQLALSQVSRDGVLSGVAQIANDPRHRASDRLKAFEMLGRYLNMWTEAPQLQQVVINMDMSGMGNLAAAAKEAVTVDAGTNLATIDTTQPQNQLITSEKH